MITANREFRGGWSVGCTGNLGRVEGRIQLGLCCSIRKDPEELSLGETESVGMVCIDATWLSGMLVFNFLICDYHSNFSLPLYTEFPIYKSLG